MTKLNFRQNYWLRMAIDDFFVVPAILVILSTLLWASPLKAGDAELIDLDFLFFGQTDGPLRVSVLQPVPGFWENLRRLDQDIGILEISDEWHNFSDADIWVFFLENGNDKVFVPIALQGLLAESYASEGVSNISGVSMDVRGIPRKILIMFNFLDKFGAPGPAPTGCLSAVFLYGELVLPVDFHKFDEIDHCNDIEQ